MFLLSSIGDSIKGILEEEGIDSRGLFDDIKDVVKLAKDMGLDDNESFFSKVKINQLQISGGVASTEVLEGSTDNHNRSRKRKWIHFYLEADILVFVS